MLETQYLANYPKVSVSRERERESCPINFTCVPMRNRSSHTSFPLNGEQTDSPPYTTYYEEEELWPKRKIIDPHKPISVFPRGAIETISLSLPPLSSQSAINQSERTQVRERNAFLREQGAINKKGCQQEREEAEV